MLRRHSSNILLRNLFFLLIIISFDISYCTINDHQENTRIMCPEIEKQALLSFKQSLEDPDNMLSSWKDDHEVNCCMWKGVVCNNLTGHVHELHLGGYGLRGNINSSLLNLKYLDYLDLSFNDFQETIPSFMGSLVSMESLNLSHAGFIGAIPRTIGNLSNLRALDLQSVFIDMGTYSENLDWLSGLSRLEQLNMNSVDLSKASNWLQVLNTLPSLSELSLRGCKLDWSTSMDSVNFSSLHTLDLSQNYFNSLVFPRWTLQLKGLVFLDLSENYIEGPIPSSSNTTRLESIDLSYNRLNSTTPDWLYSCNNLEFVYLQGNSLVGAISDGISNLSSLRVLDLHQNHFESASPGVWRSCKMHILDLSGNNLQGEMSNLFGNMSDCFMGSLEYLYLYWNQLSGHISNRFGNLKNLRVLDIRGNTISGVIPFVLGELSSLELLNLQSNKFVGNLPETLGKLSNLIRFDVSNNSLEGVVTESHFVNLSNLNAFDASRNQLTFRMSPTWVPPFQLSVLMLRSTYLNSPFPSWLITQQNLEYLDLSKSRIYGLVPSWVWNISDVDLSDNSLYGHIAHIKFGFSQTIDLSSNQFSGPMPQITKDLFMLDLSNNSISGGMSNVICDSNANATYELVFLDLSGNQLSGELPDCWMRLKNLQFFNLGDNDMNGTIPSSMESLDQLRILNLRNNWFSGYIPQSIFSYRELVVIDLSGNSFYGSLPKWTELKSDSLRFIILRSNKLSGRIDSSICWLTNIQILDISNNNLYGTIPSCFHNFTAMVQNVNVASSQEFANFTSSVVIITKGQQHTYDVLLPLVTSIDLANNNLSGNIPLESTLLVSLGFLNLSRNHLTGLIPRDIGNMKQLESLDLSLNSLTGEIPSSFTVMSYLNYLDLSYNNLTGSIPESTQLQSMSASNFVGNKLCGPPLTSSKCGVTDGDSNDQADDDNNIVLPHGVEVDWFIVLLSLGYAVGLSSFCIVMIFHKSWKEAYFRMLEDIWEKIMSSLKCNR